MRSSTRYSTSVFATIFTAWLAGVGGASAADLGDLQIPASRLPDWNPGIEGGIPDTSSWPTINARDYGAVPDDGKGDAPAINKAIDAAAAQGGKRVVYLPAGTYRFDYGTSVVMRSDVVLRGAGPTKTILTGDRGRIYGTSWGGLHFMGSAGSDIAVTSASLPRGTDTIRLANTSGLSVGDWVYMFQNNDPVYIQDGNGGPYMTHIFRVASILGNSVVMDRPLRHDFNPSKSVRVKRLNPISGAGLEDIRVQNDDDSPDMYIPTAQWDFAVGCWAKNVFFYNGHHYHLYLGRSARNTIRDCRFERLLYAPIGEFNQYSVSLEGGAVDNLVTNNIFKDLRVAVILARGANGNVVSYNYHMGGLCGSGMADFHGHYPHSNLVEGNDSNCGINIGDHYWGQQGPHNTVFRNRMRGTGRVITKDAFPTRYPFIVDSLNLLLNSAYSYHQIPGCNYDSGNCKDLDHLTTNLWAERNIATDTRSGSGYGFVVQTPERSSVLKDNAKAKAAPGSWAHLRSPASLYLESRPDFWPAHKPWPGIGADVDDFSGGNLVKLPAQDRYDGVRIDEPPPDALLSRPSKPTVVIP